MEVQINGKTYNVRKLKYFEAIEAEGLPKQEMAKKLFKLATGITDQELMDLSMEEGIILNQKINEINNLGPLPQATAEQKLN
jgi:hypothetical protein